jgi:DNA primase
VIELAMTNDVEIILQKANIADVIGRYIEIQKKSNSYVAVCPFHDDSSPSLNISVEKKIFKCFACGVGGNAIGFVQRFKSVAFQEALRIVGEYVGIKIKSYQKQDLKYSFDQEKIFEINAAAMEYFATLLYTQGSEPARKYLSARKITLDQIREFNIGYAKSKYALFNYLKDEKGFSEIELLKSSLFVKKGLEYYPVFFNRIIFPIRNIDGKVIGFSGRVLTNDKDTVKYLNTSENSVFKKSHLAYNFNNALSSIRVKNKIIILEGYMDVISLNSIDIKNAVAIMGTSLSEYQINEFKKVTNDFILFLDGDMPGVNAAIKIAKQLYNYHVNLKIVFNSSGMDPDELIKAGEKNQVVKMIEHAYEAEEFIIKFVENELKKESSSSSKKKYSEIVFDLLIHSTNNILLDQSIKDLAKLLNINEKLIYEDFENYKNDHKNEIKKIKNNFENKKVVENKNENFDHNFIDNAQWVDANQFEGGGSSEFVIYNDNYEVTEAEYPTNNLDPSPILNYEKSFPLLETQKKLDRNILISSYLIMKTFITNPKIIVKQKDIIANIPEQFQTLAQFISELRMNNLEISAEELLDKMKSDKRNYQQFQNIESRLTPHEKNVVPDKIWIRDALKFLKMHSTISNELEIFETSQSKIKKIQKLKSSDNSSLSDVEKERLNNLTTEVEVSSQLLQNLNINRGEE